MCINGSVCVYLRTYRSIYGCFFHTTAFFLPRRDGIFPLHIYSGLFVRRFFCRLMVSSSPASGVCLLSPRQPARVCTVWRSYRYRKANGLSGSRAERNRARRFSPATHAVPVEGIFRTAGNGNGKNVARYVNRIVSPCVIRNHETPFAPPRPGMTAGKTRKNPADSRTTHRDRREISGSFQENAV